MKSALETAAQVALLAASFCSGDVDSFVTCYNPGSDHSVADVMTCRRRFPSKQDLYPWGIRR